MYNKRGDFKMLLLSREDIKKVFTMEDAIECDKQAFKMLVEGKCDAPLRTNIQAPKYEGCFCSCLRIRRRWMRRR